MSSSPYPQVAADVFEMARFVIQQWSEDSASVPEDVYKLATDLLREALTPRKEYR
jgi:hypothetical protein